GLVSGRAALDVDDLVVAEGQDLEALPAAPVRAEPGRGGEDRVLVEPAEGRLDLDRAPATFVNLEAQDLTGLVGPVSGRRLVPPQSTARDAPPLAVSCDQRDERLGITAIERL